MKRAELGGLRDGREMKGEVAQAGRRGDVGGREDAGKRMFV